jgi:hypothetical protein
MKAIVFTNYLVYYLKYIILQSLLLRFFQNNKPLEYMKNAREDKAQIKLLSLQSILFDVWDHKRKRKPISSVTALLPPFPSYSFPDRKKKKNYSYDLQKVYCFVRVHALCITPSIPQNCYTRCRSRKYYILLS